MTRNVVAASAMLVLSFAGTASAQDWNGAYIGAYGGLAVAEAEATTSAPGPGTYFAGSSVDSINENGVFLLEPKKFIAGGQLGFNGQAGAAVFGIEADFGLMDLNETGSVTVEYPCCDDTSYTIQQTVDTSWLMTIRPRLGVAAGNVLVYGTGGLAMTDVDYIASFDDSYDTAHADTLAEERRTGYVLGGGVEVRAGRVSVKGEYLYADFGEVLATSENFSLDGVATPSVTFDHVTTLKAQIFRAGVNVRF